jgi:hypothetical protein
MSTRPPTPEPLDPASTPGHNSTASEVTPHPVVTEPEVPPQPVTAPLKPAAEESAPAHPAPIAAAVVTPSPVVEPVQPSQDRPTVDDIVAKHARENERAQQLAEMIKEDLAAAQVQEESPEPSAKRVISTQVATTTTTTSVTNTLPPAGNAPSAPRPPLRIGQMAKRAFNFVAGNGWAQLALIIVALVLTYLFGRMTAGTQAAANISRLNIPTVSIPAHSSTEEAVREYFKVTKAREAQDASFNLNFTRGIQNSGIASPELVVASRKARYWVYADEMIEEAVKDWSERFTVEEIEGLIAMAKGEQLLSTADQDKLARKILTEMPGLNRRAAERGKRWAQRICQEAG